ncbi:hypothetical protein B0G62_1299 [Paraburkholderia eburnea]|uniref:Uncharacterized protein n=1 Tax=Paraburkholderia eburnea TaxID=1189126 RepID=A0A2S4LTM6_9BURK|nr:hypothetical protein B0G62_1299 [Paraburkholderia eburnea]PRZ14641.1 hypothetical protein BX588_1279 [Paraburkholderia eburnea]
MGSCCRPDQLSNSTTGGLLAHQRVRRLACVRVGPARASCFYRRSTSKPTRPPTQPRCRSRMGNEGGRYFACAPTSMPSGVRSSRSSVSVSLQHLRCSRRFQVLHRPVESADYIGHCSRSVSRMLRSYVAERIRAGGVRRIERVRTDVPTFANSSSHLPSIPGSIWGKSHRSSVLASVATEGRSAILFKAI